MLSGSTVVLRDLGGINGTYVNGTRLRGTRSLLPGDRIDIGPFQLTFDGAALTRSRRIGDVELLARGVSCDVRSRRTITSPHRTLSAANLCIRPSEFVRVIGANGAGKSTLMNILSGRALPTEGTVLLNSVDLHANFQAFKRDIAYVAQQDVLHEQLTLRQALNYAAQLRLPPDTTAAHGVVARILGWVAPIPSMVALALMRAARTIVEDAQRRPHPPIAPPHDRPRVLAVLEARWAQNQGPTVEFPNLSTFS